MAERKPDLMGQLTDLSEAAIQRLAEAPGADKVLQAIKKLGDRVDDLQRRTKGYEQLEHRLAALEKKVSGLSKGSSSAGSTGSTDSPSSTTGKKS
ncbi:MAG TPA: hypothetical protein VGH79_06190 [Gaiellaceae bacterium]|jgi:hypothetical protein